jgi:hypothetical protein|tara:strand:+ start:7447 stop:7722 length:276 start_codon:yes stop_codon:yes gene_type:complete
MRPLSAFLFLALLTSSFAMQPIDGVATTMEILKAGSGAAVTKGDTVTVHATGTVVETGKKFWYVRRSNRPHSPSDARTERRHDARSNDNKP